MSIKRMSLQFNLDNESDRSAWEHLNNVTDSKNKSVITAINQFYGPHAEITEVIRKTIRECLQNFAVIKAEAQLHPELLTEDENLLLDSLDDFLGG